MYDMDSTWGLYYNGQKFVSTSYRCQEDYEAGGHGGNELYKKLAIYYSNEIFARYFELRSGALNLANVFTSFERFTDLIPSDLYKEDCDIYKDITLQSENNIQQIRNYARDRANYVDVVMQQLKK